MRLGHIGLTVSDLERAERFYRDIFGFETFFKIRRNTPWLAAQVGYEDADIEFCHMRGADGLHLELLKYWRPWDGVTIPDATYCPGNVHFNIWVEDAHAMAEKVLAHINGMADRGRARFAPQPLDIEASTISDGPQKGGKGFYMRDPDGHTIEIWQPAPGTSFGKELTPLSHELAQIIRKMEESRAANNSNWMDLIRLVYRAAPDEARKLFRKIEAQDAEILKLAQSSANVR